MTSPKSGGHQGPHSSNAPIPPKDMAAALSAKGIGCFPCNGKKAIPLWKSYQAQAPSIVQVEAWWRKHPHANSALVTGINSGITVVDVDGCGHASETLSRILAIFGPTPLVVSTPGKGGGYQLYYAYAGERNKTAWQEDDFHGDVRGEGGYVMAPGSLHPEAQTHYTIQGDLTWFIIQLSKLPTSIYKFPEKPPQKEVFKPIKGQRDNWLFGQARKYARDVDSLDDLVQKVAQSNQGMEEPLTPADVERVSQSAWGYKQNGTLMLAGAEAQAFITKTEWQRLPPDEVYLLAMLRLMHSCRASFAIGLEKVSREVMPIPWSKQRLKNAIRGLLCVGVIRLLHQGGKTKGDAHQYGWGTKLTSI